MGLECLTSCCCEGLFPSKVSDSEARENDNALGEVEEEGKKAAGMTVAGIRAEEVKVEDR